MKRSLGAMASAALAIAVPAHAADTWFEARTDHFKVFAQGTTQSVAEFATRLERLDKAMRMVRDVPERDGARANPLAVYVVPDVDTVRRLCASGRRKAAFCTNVYGFYEARVGESVAFTPRHSGNGSTFDLSAQAVLFHEYAHHFMFGNAAAAYPAWFQEGFAEFNATTVINRDGSVIVGKPPLYRAYGLVQGTPLAMATLLTGSNATLKGEAQDALYGRGWLLTHYLTFTKARAGQLTRYLLLINEGKPSLAAAQTAFGDLKTLDGELQHYLGERLFSVTLAAEKVAVQAPVMHALTPGEAAMLPARWQSRRGVDNASAPAVAAEARRRAAPFPADAGAQDALAEAEFDAGNDDAAEAAADRALAVDPKDRTAMLYKGNARLRRIVAKTKGDTPGWREARSWIVKANRAEPNDAEPLMLFYTSFLAAGLKASSVAVQGLRRAFELSPQDPSLRFLLARQDLLDGEVKDARAVLVPLAFDPHGAPDNRAAKLVALIDAGDSAAIAKLLTGEEKPGDPAD